MSRINHCQACQNQRWGVKTRIAVPHTCGLTAQERQQMHEQQEKENREFEKWMNDIREVKDKGLEVMTKGTVTLYAFYSTRHGWSINQGRVCMAYPKAELRYKLTCIPAEPHSIAWSPADPKVGETVSDWRGTNFKILAVKSVTV